MTIKLPALKRASLADIQKVYPWATKILEDTSTEEACEVEVVKCEEEHGEYPTLGTVKSRNPGVLGWQHSEYIFTHQEDYKELFAYLKSEGIYWLHFLGTVWPREDGSRYARSWSWHDHDQRWCQDYGWLGFKASGNEAVLCRKLGTGKTESSESGSSETRTLGPLETEHQTQMRIANSLERLADKFAPRKKK
jgi:hypothetical protein